ncbi:MAG: transporter [Terriglobia bacterium]
MMLRKLQLCVFASLTCCLVTATATAQTSGNKLINTIPYLYGSDGLTLPNPFHEAHFTGSSLENFTPLNSALASQLVLLQGSSPASGFTYAFDQSLGVYTLSTQNFGPILTERAETIGRHKFLLGFSYQYFNFDTIDGIDLKKIPSVFTHEPDTGPGGTPAAYEADYITSNNSISLTLNQYTTFVTFGITKNLDISAAIPIVSTRFRVDSDATIHRMQPTYVGCGGPGIPGICHYFDPNDRANSVEKDFPGSGTASGLGDITIRVKGTVWKGERAAFAAAADVRTPTGDESNFLGSGAVGFKPFAAFSYHYKRVSPEVNVGYQWNGSSVLAGDVRTGAKQRLPNQFFYAVGASVGAAKYLSFAFDLLGQRVISGERVFLGSYTDALGQSSPSTNIGKGSYNMTNGAVGFRVSPADKLLITANLLFKLDDGGLRANVVPLVGFSYTF